MQSPIRFESAIERCSGARIRPTGRVVSDTPVTDRLIASEEHKRLEEEQRAVQLAP